MEKQTKKILLIGAGAVGLASIAYMLLRNNTEATLVAETAPSTSAVLATTKKVATVSTDVKKIQVFLNNVMAALLPIATDGISGPATIARIKEFQQTIGRNNPVTGTWGTITESNALAVYGFTPFKGKQQTITPAPTAIAPSNAQLIEQGKLKALLLNQFAYPAKSSLRLLQSPSLTSPVLNTMVQFGTAAVGQISDISHSIVQGRMYTWVKLKWGSNVKGWVLLTDVKVYDSPNGTAFSTRINY